MEDGNNNNDIERNTHDSDYYRERGRVKYLEKIKFLSSEKDTTKGFKALSLKNYMKVFGADRYKEVMDDYKMALKLNPGDYLTYLYMADLADKLDDKNKCFDEAIKRNPHASEPYLKKIYENADWCMWNIVKDTITEMDDANHGNAEFCELIINLREQFKHYIK